MTIDEKTLEAVGKIAKVNKDAAAKILLAILRFEQNQEEPEQKEAEGLESWKTIPQQEYNMVSKILYTITQASADAKKYLDLYSMSSPDKKREPQFQTALKDIQQVFNLAKVLQRKTKTWEK